jgi:hypothetical protein
MILNTEQALELYKLVGKYIPQEFDGEILDFVGKIVEDIKESDTPENFGAAVMLLGDLSLDQVKELKGADAIMIFTEGLVENKITSLVEFFQWLIE